MHHAFLLGDELPPQTTPHTLGFRQVLRPEFAAAVHVVIDAGIRHVGGYDELVDLAVWPDTRRSLARRRAARGGALRRRAGRLPPLPPLFVLHARARVETLVGVCAQSGNDESRIGKVPFGFLHLWGGGIF